MANTENTRAGSLSLVSRSPACGDRIFVPLFRLLLTRLTDMTDIMHVIEFES